MKLHYPKYLFIIKSVSLITLKCVVVGFLIGIVRQNRLLIAPNFAFLYFVIVSSLYLCTVYMEGHMKLDTDEIFRYLKRFVRPTFLFVRQKEKLAKGNENNENHI